MATGRLPAHLAYDDSLAVTRPLDFPTEVGRRISLRVLILPLTIIASALLFMMVAPIASSIVESFSADTPVFRSSDPRAYIGTVYDPAAGDVKIDVMNIGDILMSDSVVASGLHEDGTSNYDHIYAHIANEIQAADIRIVNQETMMGPAERGYFLVMGENGPRFNSPTTLADATAAAGFNVVLKAHNHTYDQGYDGMAHEMAYWKANYPDIPLLGVKNPMYPEDESQNRVDNPYIYEKDGFRVAILNYSFGINEVVDWATYYEYVAPLEESKIRRDVASVRDLEADMIIVCPHWGIEYQTEPSVEQEYFFNLFCELGVDVVFGGHPHILEPARVYTSDSGHKTVCFFSTGNFVAGDMPPASMIGGLCQVSLIKTASGECLIGSATMQPLVCHKASGTDYTTYLLSDYTDELAASSELPSLTPGYAQAFCEDVLGPGYDRASSTLYVDVSA